MRSHISRFLRRLPPAFTLVELLMVMVIIGILAGLVLGTAGYVRKKGATSRAEAEIAGLSLACESYKADNGIYPTEATTTEALNPRTSYNPTTSLYNNSSLYLYKQLSGDDDADASRSITGKVYFEFKPGMLTPSGTGAVTAMVDPFGYSYGYSTAGAADIVKTGSSSKGYNPTFDMWSTAGNTASSGTVKWIKNW